ncbi:hypothetical protein ABPG74_019669 [Tetrahymena malaccensis]
MSIFYIKLWILQITFVCCLDQVPFQISSNVFQIMERNAIIYKSFFNPKWRYSIYGVDGTIQQTYIIEGLQDLTSSYYLLDEQNNALYLSTLGASACQIVDLNLLTSNQNNYLAQKNFLSSQCQQSGAMVKYVLINYYKQTYTYSMILIQINREHFTFFICQIPKFYLQELSFEALQASKNQQPYDQYLLTQTYLMFDKSLLVYKGNIFTKLGFVQKIGYTLIDLQYDLFIQDKKFLCKGLLDINTQSFSCVNQFNLNVASLQDVYISKVFNSNGLNIIFSFDTSLHKYVFFEVENLNVIKRTGVGIQDNDTQPIQNGYNSYFNNYQYTAIYNPFNNSIDIQEVFANLPQNYSLPNSPFYNNNFQQGSLIFLIQGSQNFLLNINEIYKMCNNNQYIQLDSSCDTSCPSYSINTNKQCSCKENFIILQNECVCNFPGQQIYPDGSCKCKQNYFQSEEYSIFKKECLQQYRISNSDIFTSSKVAQTYLDEQKASQASSISTQILSTVKNIVSSQSFGLISNFIVSQKLNYLSLVDVILPSQIYYFLLANKNQFCTQNYKFLNVFEIFTNENESQYQDPKYQKLGLSFNILKTSGSGAAIFLICLIIFLIFYLLLDNNNNNNNSNYLDHISHPNLLLIDNNQLIIKKLNINCKTWMRSKTRSLNVNI